MDLSAVIISRPNDQLLDKCINKVREFANEVIVVGCGWSPASGDVNVALPKDMLDAYGFAYCRNIGRNKASGRWIIEIDTDEALVGSKETLEGDIAAAEANGSLGVEMSMFAPLAPCEFGKSVAQDELKYDTKKWRVSKNVKEIFWRGLVHEELWVSSTANLSQCSTKGQTSITHYFNATDKPNSGDTSGCGLYAELLCRGYDIPDLKSTTNQWWYDQISANPGLWRTRQQGYWTKRGARLLHKTDMHRYGTHAALLSDVLRLLPPKPTIVEFGSGMYSTPMLSNNNLMSYETDPVWAHMMQQFGTQWIKSALLIEPMNVDLVFVDGITEERQAIIEKWKDHAAIIVCHDTESRLYGYQHILPQFKHKYTDVRLTPWTTAVSNHMPLDALGNCIHEYIPVIEKF